MSYLCSIMKQNAAINPIEPLPDFTATHIALLKECQEKAIAILRKDGVKMSELNSALSILIKIEKQFYYLTHRRPPFKKGKQPKQSPSETPSIIPFDSSEQHDDAPPASATPQKRLETLHTPHSTSSPSSSPLTPRDPGSLFRGDLRE